MPLSNTPLDSDSKQGINLTIHSFKMVFIATSPMPRTLVFWGPNSVVFFLWTSLHNKRPMDHNAHPSHLADKWIKSHTLLVVGGGGGVVSSPKHYMRIRTLANKFNK